MSSYRLTSFIFTGIIFCDRYVFTEKNGIRLDNRDNVFRASGKNKTKKLTTKTTTTTTTTTTNEYVEYKSKIISNNILY